MGVKTNGVKCLRGWGAAGSVRSALRVQDGGKLSTNVRGSVRVEFGRGSGQCASGSGLARSGSYSSLCFRVSLLLRYLSGQIGPLFL